ncbi:MAG: DUF4446 family protein [Bacillota bacterium]
MALLFVVVSIAQFFLYRRLAGQFKRYQALVRSAGPGLGDILAEFSRLVEQVEGRTAEITVRQRELEAQVKRCVRTPSIVRFNAFEDMGSNLSYAVGLLDGLGDGVVLSSIFGRDQVCTYAKAVVEGSSPYNLSEEEREAIRQVIMDDRNLSRRRE